AQRPTSTTNIEYHSSNAFSWGIGGRVILVYWAEMLMGVNALYMASTLPFDAIIQNGVNRRIGSSHLDYDEWQVGISFSREIGVFVPYIGLAYASMDSCLKSPPRQSSLFNPKSENLKNRQ